LGKGQYFGRGAENKIMSQEFVDKSGDKEFFTVVPNIIVNGYNATESGVYLYIKRKCGEAGQFYESAEQSAKNLGISKPTFLKIRKKLIEDGRLKFVGEKKTKGHPVKVFEVIDIWQENSKKYRKNKNESSNTVKNKTKIPSKIDTQKKNQYKEEPNISLKRDIKKTPKKEIDDLIEFLKSELKLKDLDGSAKSNRWYANHCLKKFGGATNVKKIIKIAKLDKCHRQNLTNFKYLYYNAMRIVQAYRVKQEKEKTNDLKFWEQKQKEFEQKYGLKK